MKIVDFERAWDNAYLNGMNAAAENIARALHKHMHCPHCPVGCTWGHEDTCEEALRKWMEGVASDH